MMLLMIDNYDSFTYNLVQYFHELNVSVTVYRHDQITLAEMTALAPDYLVISPGPGTPNEAGISLAAIEQFAGQIPILGVCLGHQSIAQLWGAKIVRARQMMHGKTSLVYHTQQGVFAKLPSPFRVTRYHSLVVEPESLPACLDVTAWTTYPNGERDEIMAVAHCNLPISGVQFHPESILTEHGHALLQNFLQAQIASSN